MALNRITKSQYENLKESYLTKNRSMYSLYSELNSKTTINKQDKIKTQNNTRKNTLKKKNKKNIIYKKYI